MKRRLQLTAADVAAAALGGAIGDPDALYEAGGKAAEHRIAAQAERPTEPAESGSEGGAR